MAAEGPALAASASRKQGLIFELRPLNEFARPRSIAGGLPSVGMGFSVSATSDERDALVLRLDLLALEELSASGVVRRGPRAGIIIVQGELRARVVQRCVVTFEPVEDNLTVPFERYFSLGPLPDVEEIVVGVEDEEPEPLSGESLDIGELIVEELSLSLEPYPRSPDADAVLAHLLPKDDDAELGSSPFGKLQALKRRASDD